MIDAVRSANTKNEGEYVAPEYIDVIIGFTELKRKQIIDYRNRMGFEMSGEDLISVRNYFRDVEKRDPTACELKVLDACWSENCRRRTLCTEISRLDIEENKALERAFRDYEAARDEVYGVDTTEPYSLMDIATIGEKVINARGLIKDVDIASGTIEIASDVRNGGKWLVRTDSGKPVIEKSSIDFGAPEQGDIVIAMHDDEMDVYNFISDRAIARHINGMSRVGAGGLCAAAVALADGVSIRLDDVRTFSDRPSEAATSKMDADLLFAVDRDFADDFVTLAFDAGLAPKQIAWITDNPRLRMTYKGAVAVSIDSDFIKNNALSDRAKAKLFAPEEEWIRHSVPKGFEYQTFSQAIRKALRKCLKEDSRSVFDNETRVLMPCGGKNQLTAEEAEVVLLSANNGGDDTAVAVSSAQVPQESRRSALHGAAYAVTLSLSRLAAVGADALSARLIQNICVDDSDKVHRGKAIGALLGSLKAQLRLGVPSVSIKEDVCGKDAYSCYAVVGTKASKTISAAFKQIGSRVVLFPVPENENTELPRWKKLAMLYNEFFCLCNDGKVRAASVVKENGVLAAVAKMAMGNDIGVDFTVDEDRKLLFTPLVGAIVAELEPDTVISENITFKELGRTGKKAELNVGKSGISLSEIEKLDETSIDVTCIPLMSKRAVHFAGAVRTAHPKVVVPEFCGVPVDGIAVRGFESAGAKVECVKLSGKTGESIDILHNALMSCQMLLLPDGLYDAGAGRFMAALLENERIKEELEYLLTLRGGLVLGVGSGFDALLRTGLLINGKVTDETPASIKLVPSDYNVDRIAYTRVASIKSPWLAKCELDDVHTVAMPRRGLSFNADSETFAKLLAGGQIATQYTDPSGVPSGDSRWNPGLSTMAVEGITSPSGNVFGKLGYCIKKQKDLFLNIPAEMDQKLFESGVAYFS